MSNPETENLSGLNEEKTVQNILQESPLTHRVQEYLTLDVKEFASGRERREASDLYLALGRTSIDNERVRVPGPGYYAN